MDESTNTENDKRLPNSQRRPPWFVEVIGLFGVLLCSMVGVGIAHLLFEQQPQPPLPFNALDWGMAIWFGAGAVLGLSAGVGVYWLVLHLLGYHRRLSQLATKAERQELTSGERQARARRRQSEEALWQITSPPLSSYKNEHELKFTGTGTDKSGEDPIVVVIPLHDCTPEELREIGLHLRRWLDTRPYARKVLGLGDLEAGRQPSSPGYYLFPFHERYTIDELRQRYPHDVWRAALLIVAGGFEVVAVAKDLEVDMSAICDRLARYGDPVSFDPLFL